MYAVSNAYKAAITTSPVISKIEGTITLNNGLVLDIDDSVIVRGSLTIKNQCVSKQKLDFGTAYVGEMDISIYDNVEENLLYGAVIELSYLLKVSDTTWEAVPLGLFTVSEATRTGKAIKLIAFDNMYLLDVPYNSVETAGTVFEVLTLISTTTGVELAQTQEEIEAMSNGARYITLNGSQGYESYWDIISDIAALLVGFATIDRHGKLVFVNYGVESVDTIPTSRRNSSKVADKVVSYDGIQTTVNGLDYIVLKSGLEEGTNLFELPENYLIGTGNGQEYIIETLQTIADTVGELSYTPCSFNILGNPAYELGDVLTISSTSGLKMLLMSYNWTYHSREVLKSLGASAVNASTASKTEKTIRSISSKVTDSEEVIKTYVNAAAYAIAQDWKQVIRIDFTSKKATVGVFDGQILLDVECTGTADVQCRFVYNGIVDALWQPAQTVTGGKHIITLLYPIDIPENTINDLRVQLNITSGSATVAAMHAKGVLNAKGIVAGEAAWDGTLEFEETMPARISLGNISIKPLAEDITAAAQTPISSFITSNMAPIAFVPLAIRACSETITTALEDA